MATAQTIINDAALIAGLTHEAGRTLSPERNALALNFLNQLLSSLSTEDLYVYTNTISLYTLPVNVTSFTLGPSGLLVGPRPIKLIAANIILSGVNQPRVALDILDERGYAAQTVKVIATSVPWAIYSDGAMPNTNIYLLGYPTTAYTLELFHPTALAQFSLVSDTLSAPDGYQQMLTDCLAEMLLPLRVPTADPTLMNLVRSRALSSRARVARLNAESPRLKSDAPTGRGRERYANWVGGWF